MIVTETKGWRKIGEALYETEEGLKINAGNLKDVCSFTGIPATLIAVDKKYGTSTLQQVLAEAQPRLQVLTKDDKVQILDPRSQYVDDDKFESLIKAAEERTGLARTKEDVTDFGKRVTFDIPKVDSDNFCGDIFTKSMTIERLPEGGINFATALLRQVCTNGMVLPDSQFKHLARTGEVANPLLTAFGDTVKNLNLDEYFKSLFMKNGEYVMASVADYEGMHQTLAQIASTDLADVLFPMDPIKSFYEAQNVNIDSISRMNLTRLPAGIKFYECFNILTHGAKSAEKTIANEIAVANWCRPSRLRQMKESDISFKGAPHFDAVIILSRMGNQH